jgi:hypothetical protein
VVAKGDRRYGGADRKNRYGDLGEAFAALASCQALIDGEIIVQDERGVSSFAALHANAACHTSSAVFRLRPPQPRRFRPRSRALDRKEAGACRLDRAAHSEASDFAQAERLYRRCADLDHTDPAAAFNLANLLRAQGRHGEAKVFFCLATEIEPGFRAV